MEPLLPKAFAGFRQKICVFFLAGISLFTTTTLISTQFQLDSGWFVDVIESSEFRQKKNPSLSSLRASPATKAASLVSSDDEPSTCRVAVLNSKPIHYETLESIAAQLPLRFLHESIQDTSKCSHIVYDYHIFGKQERAESWKTYFEASMQGNTFIQDDGRRRTIGNLTLHRKLPADGIVDPYAKARESSNATTIDKESTTHLKYDAVVEASCYCHSGEEKDHVEWLQQNEIRSCIFHQACPQVAQYPRAVWPSPHHEHYYIPYKLPDVKRPKPDNKKQGEKSMDLCVVGGTSRRSWELLPSFLDSEESTQYNVRIRIFGFGSYPEALLPYQNRTTMASPVDYEEFHDEVANGCDAILMLVTKSMNSKYFLGKGSLLKLSGVIPIVMAYQFPVVMHEEIYDLYQNDLPAHLLHATHNDEPDTFVAAMKEFLPRLQSQLQAPKRVGRPSI